MSNGSLLLLCAIATIAAVAIAPFGAKVGLPSVTVM